MEQHNVYSANTILRGDSVNAKEILAYTVEDACTVTGFTRTRLYQAIGDGSLNTFKAGKRRMLSAKALQDFIGKLENASKGRAS